ncbi:alpha/beta hydrolase [bacterium]|nr:alpha/beta hydrolase [bacterium]RQV98465.1 MAG: alpha/beta hydrolase [bacterium]
MVRVQTGDESAKIIPPQQSTFEQFPESTVFAEGIEVIPADYGEGSCRLHIGVEYAQKSDMTLHLHIIEPSQNNGENNLFPLIVYIQGSAWFQQNTTIGLPQLLRFAQRGFVIASVEYRPSTVAPFPAQIKDTKTALRFMIKNAERYHVNPQQIVLWGDSSGGHTAVMAGVTLDNPDLDDESPTDDPIEVKAVVDYYGPTDISKMNEEPSTMDHIGPTSPEGMLIGGLNVLENPEKVAPTVPMNYISEDRAIPPILIIHGNKDRLVPFGQSVMLFKTLKESNHVVECYQLKGADHGGSPFWAENVLNIVETFIRNYL